MTDTETIIVGYQSVGVLRRQMMVIARGGRTAFVVDGLALAPCKACRSGCGLSASGATCPQCRGLGHGQGGQPVEAWERATSPQRPARWSIRIERGWFCTWRAHVSRSDRYGKHVVTTLRSSGGDARADVIRKAEEFVHGRMS